jgi:hypothetical protein
MMPVVFAGVLGTTTTARGQLDTYACMYSAAALLKSFGIGVEHLPEPPQSW